jgi:hypothetical protein
MFGLGVNWSRYVQVRQGMSKSDVIKILGTRFEAGRTQEVWLKGQPRRSSFPVLTWWGFFGNGKIEVAFDNDDLCRWKQYDPYAHDSRVDGVRE